MSALAFVSETFAPLWRRRTYAAGALPPAGASRSASTAFLLLVVGGAVGVGLAIVWIGVPILLGLLAASRAFAAFDRGLANRLLGTAIPAPAAQRERGGSLWAQVKALVRSRTTWRSILWLTLRFPLGLAAFVVPVTIAGTGAALIVAPFTSAFTGAHRVIAFSGGTTAACVAGGLALCCSRRTPIDGLAWIHGADSRGACSGRRAARSSRCCAARTERADARADLARELHDSVGHSVTAAVLQASAARRVLDTDPAFVDDALRAIEDQGREALDELDRVLAVLRDETGEHAARADARRRRRSARRARARPACSSPSRAAATSSASPPRSAARPTACCRRR